MIIGGRVENLTVNGNVASNGDGIAGIVGNIKNGTIYKCTNNASISAESSLQCGGIAGHCINSTIGACTNSGNIKGKTLVGGIAGEVYNSSQINGCTNSGQITSCGTRTQSFYSYPQVIMCHGGGITGALYGNATINSCSNSGTINTSTALSGNYICLGGISGLLGSTINMCNNKGDVIYKSTNGLIGGIVGYSVDATVNQCYNTKKIQGRLNGSTGCVTGGIVGWQDGGTLKNCYNTASIEGGTLVGGLSGGADGRLSKKRAYIYNCYSANTSILGNSTIETGTFMGTITYSEIKSCCFITDTKYIGTEQDDIIWTSWKFLNLQEMKTSSSGLLTMLNTGDGAGLWAQDNKNSGLPYLKNNQP